MADPLPVALLKASPFWDGLDGGTLVVACSGGRDSVALARAAHALINDTGFCTRFSDPPQMWLWHMDHGLRPESEDDVEFVRQFSLELDVECEVYHAELRDELTRNGGNAEEIARAKRYQKLLERLGNPDYLLPMRLPAVALTAHHLGDQAETILFNLVRGTHLAGLRGIAEVRDSAIWRPWLTLPPQAIDAYLAELEQGYVDDPTNADTRLARNMLRHEVIPNLKEINPRALEHIARLSLTARTALKYLRRELAQLPVECFTEQAINRWLPLCAWPRGSYDAFRLDDGWLNAELTAQYAAEELKSRYGALTNTEHNQIMGWALAPAEPLNLRDCRLNLAHPRLLAITALKESGDATPSVELALGETMALGGLTVSLGKPSQDEWRQHRTGTPEPWEHIRSWPQALDALTASPPLRPAWHCFLSAEAGLPLTLRAWHEGDRIELSGGGKKKLGDIFTDAKLPACFRPVWAVLADGADNVLWVPGLADGRLMQLKAGSEPAYLVSLRESG